MNTEVLEQALRIMTEKLAHAELNIALLQAQLALKEEGEKNAKTDNAN